MRPDTLMDSDLRENLAERELLDVPRLVEHLFPDTLFSAPMASISSAVNNTHRTKATRLHNYWDDFSSAVPDEMTHFLNGVCGTIQTMSQEIPVFPKKIWVAEHQNPFSYVLQARCDHLGKDTQGPAGSTATLALLEFTRSENKGMNAYAILAKRASRVLATQDERRFVIGVSICSSDVRVYVFDRAGVIGSAPFDLVMYPDLLVRVLAGLTLADGGAIGLDPSIRHAEDGTRYVTVDALEYRIVRTLFHSEPMRGRGTICWHVRRNDLDYVIKNNWTDVSRHHTEADVLRRAESVQGIAHLVGEEVVRINGREDSTDSIRSVIKDLNNYDRRDWYNKLEVRVHRRMVTSPLGEPLSSFRSKKELLMVLIDVIDAHHRLVKAHILHRDISVDNIMISRTTAQENHPYLEKTVHHRDAFDNASQEPFMPRLSALPTESKNQSCRAKGFLIDLEYALITHDLNGNKIEQSPEPIAYKMGTLPFIAIEILWKGLGPEKYEAYHDLQSFFFVLLWIALEYAGPGNAERRDIDIEDKVLKSWLEGNTFEQIGLAKAVTLTTTKFWFDLAITRYFRPYFDDLKPCIEELRQRIFLPKEQEDQIGHQDFIDILQKVVATLPDDDNWSWENDPIGYGVVEG